MRVLLASMSLPFADLSHGDLGPFWVDNLHLGIGKGFAAGLQSSVGSQFRWVEGSEHARRFSHSIDMNEVRIGKDPFCPLEQLRRHG